MADWHKEETVEVLTYVCGYCGTKVTSNLGYLETSHGWRIRICPCGHPSFFDAKGQYPASLIGNPVGGIPSNEVQQLYEEARLCASANAYTSAVLTCRKLLMHIAVEKKAPTGKQFIEYVEYLSDNHYVPPDGKEWVDYIRQKGNEANHEICLMNKQAAEDLISFTEMLLRFVYEFPSKVRTLTTDLKT